MVDLHPIMNSLKDVAECLVEDRDIIDVELRQGALETNAPDDGKAAPSDKLDHGRTELQVAGADAFLFQVERIVLKELLPFDFLFLGEFPAEELPLEVKCLVRDRPQFRFGKADPAKATKAAPWFSQGIAEGLVEKE